MMAKSAMRDILKVMNEWWLTWQIQNAGRWRPHWLQGWIARICDPQPIDTKGVPIELRCERSNGHTPNSLLILRQGLWLSGPLAGNRHFSRLGCTEPKSHAAVWVNFRRDDRRGCGWPCSRSLRALR